MSTTMASNTTANSTTTVNTVAGCPALDSSLFDLTSLDTSRGALVNLTCHAFGHRVVGSGSLLCNGSSSWEPAVPSCQWTWVFSTHELVVLGTALGCLILTIIVIVATIIACCCCRRRSEKGDSDVLYADNGGYSGAVDSGIYPDAYFAYQDVSGDKETNGNHTPTDSAWLGYIPRPKVAEDHYYDYR